jgi:hypothetical protein
MTYAFSLLTNGVALALTIVVLARLLALAGALPPYRDSMAALLILGTWPVRNPWKPLSVSHATIGTWEEYVPIVAKVVRGELFTP